MDKNQHQYKDTKFQVPALHTYLSNYFGHQLRNVVQTKQGTVGYVNFLLKNDKGYYICLLSTVSGQKTYIVGIDCLKKEIYDCMESNILRLSLETLNYCAGKTVGGLDGIYICMELIKAP